jgi:hypothetical protein
MQVPLGKPASGLSASGLHSTDSLQAAWGLAPAASAKQKKPGFLKKPGFREIKAKD